VEATRPDQLERAARQLLDLLGGRTTAPPPRVVDQPSEAVWNAGATHVGAVAHTGFYSDIIWHMVFSADGRRLATANYNNKTAWAWQLPSGRQLARLKHPKRVSRVALDADGHLLASACEDKVVRVWEVDSGARVAEIRLPYPAGALAFTPDSLRLAIAGRKEGTAQVWDLPTARRVLQLELSHRGYTVAVDVSPDGRRLATGVWGTASVYDLETGSKLLDVEIEDSIILVRFCRGGRRLAVAGQASLGGRFTHSSASVWELPSGRSLAAWGLGVEGGMRSASISEDGQWLAACAHYSRLARVWDLGTGKAVVYLEHPHSVSSMALTPDGRLLAVDAGNKSVYFWVPKT
jgi:WD40 repeat protein